MINRMVGWIPSTATLLVSAALAAWIAPAEAAEPRQPAVMQLPYPDVWGVRLPPPPPDYDHSTPSFLVSRETGDIVIGWESRKDLWLRKRLDPYTHTYYGFFRREILYQANIPADNSDAYRDDLKFSWTAVAPWPLQDIVDEIPLRFISNAVQGPMWLDTYAEGPLLEKPLFDLSDRSLFPSYHVRQDATGKTIADKVFVEVFDVPTAIQSPGGHLPEYEKRIGHVRAMAPGFYKFAILNDGTILTVAAHRLLAVRLTRTLDSPFFKQDGHILALDGPMVRQWVAEAQRRVPDRFKRDTNETVAFIDAELTEKILQEWRRQK